MRTTTRKRSLPLDAVAAAALAVTSIGSAAMAIDEARKKQ
jgi:hypothetical protein